MFLNIDSDGNGSMDYTEFVVAAIDMLQFLTEERLQAAFKLQDRENTGFINTKNIPIEQFFGQVDEDTKQ